MTESRKQDDTSPDGSPAKLPAEPKGRKRYRSPALVEYGPIAKLTQGTLSRNSDFFSGGFRMANNMGMGMCL